MTYPTTEQVEKARQASLLALTPKKLMSIKNLGKVAYKEIVTKLNEYGLQLKDDEHAATGGQ